MFLLAVVFNSDNGGLLAGENFAVSFRFVDRSVGMTRP